MDFELDQIAEATGLLLQTARFKQELLFEGGELQVGRKGVNENFIVHVQAKEPLPQMAILSLTQTLVQNTDEIRSERWLKIGLRPVRLEHDAGLAIALVLELLAHYTPVQALQEYVEAAVKQSLDADQPSDAPDLEDRRIAVILVLPAFLQECHSDTLPSRGSVGHHLAVPRLEDVQG